jgi:hypothetical protein
MAETLPGADTLDTAQLQTGSQLRALGRAELARLGEESLRSHLVDMAILAHQLYAPVSGERLNELLANRNLVRYPVRLSFEVGSMASHQFAQPEATEDGFKLSLHPALKNRPADIAFAVAYFIPVMNFGSLIDDDHCLIYGATLHGMTIDAYYAELCRIANLVGAPVQTRGDRQDRF